MRVQSLAKRFSPHLTHLGRQIHTSAAANRIVKSRYPDVEVSNKNMYDFVWENVDQHPKHVTLVDGLTDHKLDRAESRRQAGNFGAHMQRTLGAEKGDVCALFLFNCVEYPLVFSGCARVGVTLTTLNPIYTPVEIAKQLRMSHAKWAITSKELLPHFTEAIEKLAEGNQKVIKQWKDKTIIVGGN